MAGAENEPAGRNGQQNAGHQSPWSSVIRETFRDFVSTIGESSRQLAAAAERLAGESLHLIDDFAGKAEHSAETSTSKADEAGRFAAEARQAAEQARERVEQARERVIDEARVVLQNALSQSQSLQESADRLRGHFQAQIEEALQQLSASVQAGNEAAAAARQAAEEAQAAAESARAAVTENDKASSEAEGAHSLVQRLEAEHDRLLKLVEELHARVHAIAQGAPAGMERVAGRETIDVAIGHEHEPLMRAEQSAAGYGAAEADSVSLQGRLRVTLEPVDDFDRLLSLDAALSRMAGVDSVSLSDYDREQAVFRVEVRDEMSADVFVRALAESAAMDLRAQRAEAGSLTLRIV